MKTGISLFFSFLLFFLSLFCAEAEIVFFRSDVVGIAIEKIPWYRADEYQYVLRIETTGRPGSEIKDKVLLKNGREVKRWKFFYNDAGMIEKEMYYEGKELKTESSFDKMGRVVGRKAFKNSKLLSLIRYSYVGNLLKERYVTNDKNEELWEEHFFYDRWNRLVKVVKKFPDGRRFVSLYNIGDEGLYDEVQSFGVNEVVFHYDSEGREAERDVWKHGKLLSSKSLVYYGDSSKLKLVRIVYPREKKRVIESYNSRGFLIDRKEYVGETLEREESCEWNGDLLIKKRIREKGKGIELYIYFYDASKKLVKEEHWVKGELETLKEYTGNKSMVESFYRNGKVFLRSYYLNDRKVREEIIENGKVVRERKFE